MLNLNYIGYFLILIVAGMLYEKFQQKYKQQDEVDNNLLIQKFLLNKDTNLGGKPLLWVHSTHTVNARYWPSFYSRNTSDLNQPYIPLCVKSIIKHNSNSFNVLIIDDSAFEKLIPGWNINMNNISDPVKSHIRTMGLMKLLYYYGGLLCPNSYVAMKDLRPLYDTKMMESDCFAAELPNRSVTYMNQSIIFSPEMIGCKQHSKTMKSLIGYLEQLNSIDYTSDIEFLGLVNRELTILRNNGSLGVISGKQVGVLKSNCQLVQIEELMGNQYISLDSNLYGIVLPAREILERTKYNWFARMSSAQVLDSDTMAGKYILLALGNTQSE